MLSICRNLTAVNISRKFIYSILSANMSSVKFRKLHTGEEIPNATRLVWVDCEMTGLNKEVDHLLEIACLVTDANLQIVAEGPNIVIHQPNKVLDVMGDWCREHHGQSGLTEAVQNSKVSLADAENEVLKFVEKHTPKRACPLAGNSIHSDREFLIKYMPRLINHLHYRIVDVSTIKELCRRWYPNVYKQAPRKKLSHRALDDIKESIAELKYYKNSIFIN